MFAITNTHFYVVLSFFFKEKLLHYEELYLTVEQERQQKEDTINQVTGKFN